MADLLAGLTAPDGFAAALAPNLARPQASVLRIDWEALPPQTDPLAGTLALRVACPRDLSRFDRKRRQVEAFGAALQSWLARRNNSTATVVDFGCGSGNLLLPLAASFPKLHFVGVDMRRRSIHLLEQRVVAAGLRNVRTWHGPIEGYTSSGLGLDLALGLHVCGEASDRIIIAAVERHAAWIVSPCCIGSINWHPDELGMAAEIPMEEGEEFTLEKGIGGHCWINVRGERMMLYGAQQIHDDGSTGPTLLAFREDNGSDKLRDGHFTKRRTACAKVPALLYVLDGPLGAQRFTARADVAMLRRGDQRLARPRSAWLASQISEEAFAELACLADASRATDEFRARLSCMAKTAVTLDRGLWARERGHQLEWQQIQGLQGYAKDDLLCGCPVAGT